MKLDARQSEKPAGVLIDEGTGKRIPFAIWADFETGQYEAYMATQDGKHILAKADGVTPIRVRGKAKGRLKLLEWGRAKPLIPQDESTPKQIDLKKGLEQYKEVYFKVWEQRGQSPRQAGGKWGEFLRNSSFLDDFLLRRR